MKMEQTERSETLAFKLQTLVNHPEESIRHSEHGDSLKTRTLYSGPSSYDRPDIRTNLVTIKILVLTYDQSLELRPECRSRPKRVSACAVVNKDPRCVRKRQSEPRYACLWTEFRSVHCFI
jgi:hypothetical protein